jgi:hypothetical protein
MLDALILSGHAADLILAVMALELIGITLLLARRGKKRHLPGFFAGIMAGACLVLALRAALTGGEPWLIGLCLIGSFAAHGVELAFKFATSDNVDGGTNPDQGHHA